MKLTILKDGTVIAEGDAKECQIFYGRNGSPAPAPVPRAGPSSDARNHHYRPSSIAKVQELVTKWNGLTLKPSSISRHFKNETGKYPSGSEVALFRRLAHLDGKVGQRKHTVFAHDYPDNEGLMQRIIPILADGAFHASSDLIEGLNLRNPYPRLSITGALRLPLKHSYIICKYQTMGATLTKESAFQLTPSGFEWAMENGLIRRQGEREAA